MTLAEAAPSDPRQGRRWIRFGVRAGLLVTGVVVVYVAVTFVQVWSASRNDGARPAQAIIVLGAAQYDGRPSPVLEGRLDHAVHLYRDGLADVVVVTGGRQEGDRFTEATAGYNYLRGAGLPDEAIRKEVQGTNTWEQLAAAARFLGTEGIDDVLLVSDPYHSYRLQGVADELGLDARVSPTDAHQSTFGELRALMRETAAVSVGRIIGYRRLVSLND